jgi:hypothetical protein
MNPLYNTPEKRTVARLILWFLLIAGNVHFYYCKKVMWALETDSRGETMAFVAFLDISLAICLLAWQSWDGFEKGIGLRYFFSFGLAVLSYVVFYPAFYNSVHAFQKIKDIYTLSGHPVVLTGYGILASIAAFWTFTGMFPTEAWDYLRGREKQNRIVNWIHSFSESLKHKADRRRLKETEPDKVKIIEMKQDLERVV